MRSIFTQKSLNFPLFPRKPCLCIVYLHKYYYIGKYIWELLLRDSSSAEKSEGGARQDDITVNFYLDNPAVLEDIPALTISKVRQAMPKQISRNESCMDFEHLFRLCKLCKSYSRRDARKANG